MFVHLGRSLDPTIERLTQGLDKGRKVAAQLPIFVPPLAFSVSPPLALHRLINFSSTCSESVDDISL